MFDDHTAQPQPRHRNLPRGGLALPFPDQAFSVTPDTAECALCGQSASIVVTGSGETGESPTERINTRWARHLASISHELRTPLTGIAGFASLLDGPDLNDEQHQLVKRISACSDTMLAMVNDLLDEAMAQNGDVRIASKPFAPAQLARDCTAMVAAAHGTDNTVLSCRIDQSVPPLARGDAIRVRQIITNLLANAAQATEKNGGGTVQLVLRQRARRLVWSVVDNGPGLSAEKMRRIFLPFEQASITRADDSAVSGNHSRSVTGMSAGVGLGLSIAQKLAEKMGGKITVRSTPGRGSVFSFHQSAKQTHPAHVPLASLNALQLPRILVCQSSESERVQTEAILQAFGFQFDHINTAVEAITMLRTAELNDYPYIALMMDLDHEPDTALHVVRTLRVAGMTPHALPAFALSHDSQNSENAALCEAAGFQSVLSKPLSHAAFTQLAQGLIAPTPQQAKNHITRNNAVNAVRL